MARNSDVCHSELAIRGADTAANVVETVMANWIVQKTVFLTNWSFLQTPLMGRVTNTTAVRRWFAAVSSIITEARGTFLPANGSITAVSFFALVVAKCATLILEIGEPAIT